MRFHLPKPLHGWRQLLGEIGIIVVGVLIALAAQQFVENLNHRSEAMEARAAIQGELEINMARLASRSAQRPCVDRRLAEIQSILDHAAGGGEATPPNWVGRPQFWTMQSVRWDAVSQAGRAALLPTEELADYGNMYTIMRNVTGAMITEQADWARLRSLQHLHRLTPEMLFDLNNTLQDARYMNWRVKVWTTQVQATSAKLKLKKVENSLPASRSACIPTTTPPEEAERQSNSPYGEP